MFLARQIVSPKFQDQSIGCAGKTSHWSLALYVHLPEGAQLYAGSSSVAWTMAALSARSNSISPYLAACTEPLSPPSAVQVDRRGCIVVSSFELDEIGKYNATARASRLMCNFPKLQLDTCTRKMP